MVKISVIVPIYNVEEYLRETLDSLLNQTMIEDMEVIMVDDGSTDNSRYIVNEYAEAHDNFHAFHKKNEGQAIARNYGLDIARGEYVHFMDADDYLHPTAYEKLYYFNPYNDFIVGNVLKFGEYNIWENILFKKAFKDFDGDVKSFRLSDYPNVLWDTITCNKLYKKEFLDKYDIRFINKNVYYEDLLFSLQTYVFADSIGFSRSIFYFWRHRKDKSSITQRQDDVRNFHNRLEVLNAYHSLMEKYDLDENLRNVVYSKWLHHDLKTSLKKIRNYPGKFYPELITNTNDLLNLIPDDLKEDLNFYLKILYRMVENRDINSLLLFAHLEANLKENPQMKLNISDEYLKHIDFDCQAGEKEFEAHVTGVFNDDKMLYLEFSHNLDFSLNDCPHETLISLITRGALVPLRIEKNYIIIPLDLLKDENHLKIKVLYLSDSFKRQTLLKNYSRKSIRYANYDIDLGIGINNILYLDVKRKTQNKILINDIAFENENIIFRCESLNEVSSLVLTNYVTFNEIAYPAQYSRNSNEFIFAIPFEDISNNIINKWELNSPDSYNSISLAEEFRFVHHSREILFKNKRNKIFISNKSINEGHDIDELLLKNDELVERNNYLSDENLKLNRTIQEFKSRRLIRLVDSFNKILRR